MQNGMEIETSNLVGKLSIPKFQHMVCLRLCLETFNILIKMHQERV